MQNDYLNNKKFYSENNDNYKKVNINKLLNKLKIKKKKNIKENWIFAGLIISVISITGIVIIF